MSLKTYMSKKVEDLLKKGYRLDLRKNFEFKTKAI